MRVLVVGATGFIGGAIARRLVEDGHEVRGLARERGAAVPEGVEPHVGNLGDPEAIAAAAAEVEVIVHAAGITSGRAAERALSWTHVAGAENVVNAARHAGVRRLIYISCGDVTLDNVDRVQWDEARTLSKKPVGVRARTLQLAEEVVISGSTPSTEALALRPAWVWGPGDTSRLPGLLREAKEGGIRLVGDGATYLSTTYIDHLTGVLGRALEAPGVAGLAFHVCDPFFQHARDFFFALSDALGLPPPRSSMPLGLAWPLARLGTSPSGFTADELLQRGRSTLFDFNSAIGKLDYEPSVEFTEGLEALAAWVEAQGGVDAVMAQGKAPPDAATVDRQVTEAGGD